MIRTSVTAFVGITLLFVVYVEGIRNPFGWWNAVPLVIALVLLLRARPERGIPAKQHAMAIGFALFATLPVLLVHLAWQFDWGAFATGSSTAGLVFIFLPFYALAFGALGAAGGWAVAAWQARRRR